MFKLINKSDVNVFSNNIFLKNADFFKDSIAFFDAYSQLCEAKKQDIPNYCLFNNQEFCLEGVCLFFKTYATEFSFKTLDLTIDYLKTIYYSIASLSKNGETVERDLLVNEFLIYKDANEKYFNTVKNELEKAEKKYKSTKSNYDEIDGVYKKYMLTTKSLKIFSIIAFVLSFILAMIPVALYYAKILILKTAIVYVVGIVIIGLTIFVECKFLSKYYLKLAKENAYSSQIIKKELDEALMIFKELSLNSGRIFSENYEYQKSIGDVDFGEKIAFCDILKMASNNSDFKLNSKKEILKTDINQQNDIYEFVDKISMIEPFDVGRFENIYLQIEKEDYLKFNKLVRYVFLNKFIENAEISKKWKLNLDNRLVNPFGFDIINLLKTAVAYNANRDQKFEISSFDSFNYVKYSRKNKNLNLKNAVDENSFYLLKAEYVKHFYDYELLKEERELFESKLKNNRKISNLLKRANKIPRYIELKLSLIKNRLICNSLGESDFENIIKIINQYENAVECKNDLLTEKQKVLLTEITKENEKLFNILILCEVRDLDNDEVLCTVQGQTIKGYKFSNI